MQFSAIKPIIFLHIPRTGGMSFRKIMEAVYKTRNIGRPYWGHKYDKPITDEVRNKKAWYGHFKFGLHKELKQEVKYITIIREPVARLLSEYHRNHYRERYNWAPIDLARSLDRQALALGGNNLMTRMLSGSDLSDLDTKLTYKHVELALQNLTNHFVYVGLTEQFNLLTLFVKNKLHWPIESIPHENKGPTTRLVDKAEIEALKEAPELQLDIELYHKVLSWKCPTMLLANSSLS